MLENPSMIDPLTGLSNRRALQRLAEHEFRRRDRYGLKPLALGLIDVDHLKEINRFTRRRVGRPSTITQPKRNARCRAAARLGRQLSEDSRESVLLSEKPQP